jgi:endogenous inhibitor of DNA gyrase (YacG/DUF329 family)
MIQARCPTCSKTCAIDCLDDLPSFPFCSDRCRLIDLGRWIDGVYAIPGRTAGEYSSASRQNDSQIPFDDDPDESS